MFRQSTVIAIAFLVTFCGWTGIVRQSAAADLSLISPSDARRFGLDIAWFTHAKTDRARGRVVNIHQYISPTRSFSAFEVRYGQRRLIFSEKDVDLIDEAIKTAEDETPEGKQKAREKRKARTKLKAENEVRRLQIAGIKAELAEIVIPEITLYVVNDRGGVQAIDAETGKSIWNTSVGEPTFPTLDVAANDKYVATVNGSSIYVIKASTGEVEWNRKTVRVPGAGPVLSDDFVHIPTTTGMLESFSLAEPRKPPAVFQSFGRVLLQPTMTTHSVAWTTDRGHMYVAHANKRGVKFRVVAADTVTTRPVFYPPSSLFMTSVDGYIYHVHEGTGDIFWRFSVGKPILKEPFVMGDSVYVIGDRGGLYSINFETGQEQWWLPGITKFIAGTGERLYCKNELGRMVVLDRLSGARLGVLGNEQFDLEFVNQQTDRLILATKTGVIQCLREIPSRWPTIHYGLEEGAKAPDGEKPEAKPKDKPMPMENADPFGNQPAGGEDPFGGGAGKPAAPADDPFGGGAAPPAKKPAPADDPFGN